MLSDSLQLAIPALLMQALLVVYLLGNEANVITILLTSRILVRLYRDFRIRFRRIEIFRSDVAMIPFEFVFIARRLGGSDKRQYRFHRIGPGEEAHVVESFDDGALR